VSPLIRSIEWSHITWSVVELEARERVTHSSDCSAPQVELQAPIRLDWKQSFSAERKGKVRPVPVSRVVGVCQLTNAFTTRLISQRATSRSTLIRDTYCALALYMVGHASATHPSRRESTSPLDCGPRRTALPGTRTPVDRRKLGTISYSATALTGAPSLCGRVTTRTDRHSELSPSLSSISLYSTYLSHPLA
jgi:hypothetical protein